MKMNKFKTGLITIPGLLLSTQIQAISLGFFPSTANLTAGDPFSVDLRLSDVGANQAVGDYDFDINFESNALSINQGDVVFGNQLQQSGVSSLQSVTVGNGQVSIAEVSLNDASILNALQSDDFTVATLNFTAEQTGVSQLGVSVNALGTQDGIAIAAGGLNPGNLGVARIRVRDLSRLTDLQRESGRVVRNVCNGFMSNQGARTADQQDLANVTCGLVSNINISDEALGSAYQNLAGEETFAAANMAISSVIGHTHMLRTQLANRRNASKIKDLSEFASTENGYLTLAALGLNGATGGSAGNSNSLAYSERLSGFIDASANFGETDQTAREVSTHFNKEEVTVGMDYRFTEQFVSGLAVTYSNAVANFQKSFDVSGGQAAEQGYAGSVYSSYYLDNLYVDGIFSYTRRDYDIERNTAISSQNLSRKAKGDTESDQYSASLALGYNLDLQGFDLNPYAQVSYTRLEIENYSERGAQGLNLNIESQNVESLESVLGGRLAYAWSHTFGVILPQLRAEWHHEFKENSRTLKTSYVNDINNTQNILRVRNDNPDRDFAVVGVGVSGVFRGGLQVFTAFETLLAQEDTSSHKFTAGFRLAF